MPEISLTSVDFPAPLSPTRATTSWAWTSNWMSVRAWTAPKCLLTPRSSRSGTLAATTIDASSAVSGPETSRRRGVCTPRRRSARRPGASRDGVALLDAGCGAGGRVVGGADLRGGIEPVRDDAVHDRLGAVDLAVQGDRNDGDDLGSDVDGAVVLLGVELRRVDGLALDHAAGGVGGCLGQCLDRLVDGHELVAGDDPLDRGELGILAGHRDLGRV